MSGDLLLRETQRTADETLLEQQDLLVKLKEKLSTADKDLEKNKTQLVESERKMATMERDVRRHRERQAIEDALLIEEVALPYAQYTEARDAYQQARRDKNVLKERLDTLRDNNAPLMGQKEYVYV
jgi:predicted  nucleic acid-binding Zn-ribbon protein